MNFTDKNPTLSGDFDSPELSALQTEFSDMVKMVCKVALNISESPVTLRVERPDGLHSYMRKMQEAVDKGQPLDREQAEALEQEIRYHEITSKIENKTEMIRMVGSRLANHPKFKEVADKMIEEAIQLSFKRANTRHFAESTQARDLGV